MEKLDTLEAYRKQEAEARWVCCPMCDKKKCERNADDCDVNRFLEDKESEEEK